MQHTLILHTRGALDDITTKFKRKKREIKVKVIREYFEKKNVIKRRKFVRFPVLSLSVINTVQLIQPVIQLPSSFYKNNSTTRTITFFEMFND